MAECCVKDPVTSLWRVVPDTRLEHDVKTYISTTWGTAGAFFPGPQPISIERRHFPILKGGEYAVCEKTDGVRHLLVSFMFGDKKMCILVNRVYEMTLVPISLPKSAYQGTVLDGELVEKTFLVYDAVTVSGTCVKNLPLNERLDAVCALQKGILRTKSDPITIRVKTFFSLCDFGIFVNEYLPTISYPMDGLVFTPLREPIRTGTHETMFKWKPRDRNTIDFQCKRWNDQDKWGMYVMEKGRLVFESEVLFSRANETCPGITEDAIVECQYMCDEHPRWWKPLVIRRDKTHPNNRRTFYRTLVNIKEDIKISEF